MKNILILVLLFCVPGFSGPFRSGDNVGGIFSTATAGSGDVTGPNSATDNAPACYNGISGKELEECGAGAIAYAKLNLAASIVNADVSNSASIAYSKLNLAGAILNSDISASAAIAYAKLALTGTIVNADISGSAAIAYSKLNLASSIVNADVSNSAAIAYSKLNLAGAILNADVSASAAIAYSKLSLTGSIVNADVSGSAAIAYSKLDMTGQVEFAGVTITDPTATVVLEVPSMPYAVTITSVSSICSAGTISGQVTNNAGTALTGCTSSDINTTSILSTDTCTANNSISAGHTWKLTLSSDSTTGTCSFQVVWTKA